MSLNKELMVSLTKDHMLFPSYHLEHVPKGLTLSLALTLRL